MISHNGVRASILGGIMANKKLNFKAHALELKTQSNLKVILDDHQVANEGFSYKGALYMPKIYILNDIHPYAIFISLSHGRTSPYAENLVNSETLEARKNTRGEKEVEPRNQSFMYIAPLNQRAWISSNKNVFQWWLKEKLSIDCELSLEFGKKEDFFQEVQSIEDIRISLKNPDLLSGTDPIRDIAEPLVKSNNPIFSPDTNINSLDIETLSLRIQV